MRQTMRGVFLTCADMQGSDKIAVGNAEMMAKIMYKTYEAALLKREIPVVEKTLGRKISEAEVEELMQKMGLIVRVIKTEIKT